jgi:hypothetical protein
LLARGIVFLRAPFLTQKDTSKLLDDAFYCMFGYQINSLRRSDPG